MNAKQYEKCIYMFHLLYSVTNEVEYGDQLQWLAHTPRMICTPKNHLLNRLVAIDAVFHRLYSVMNLHDKAIKVLRIM